jgi:hypothetical protein
MIGLGFLARAILGANTVADGLRCQPTSPASMNVVVGPGSLTQMGPIDLLAYGSIAADATDQIVKMGINIARRHSVSRPRLVSVNRSTILLRLPFKR